MKRRTLLQGLGAGAMLMASPRALAQAGVGRWTRFESENFVYYTSGNENRAREDVAVLEGFHALLTRLMPRSQPSPLKLTVYATSNQAEFQAAEPGMGEMVLGFYKADIEEIRAVTTVRRDMDRQRDMPRNTRAMDARTVLLHEYAHHYMLANNRKGYPGWYVEGFAEFLSTAEFNDKGVDVGKVTVNRAMWAMNGDWMPIEMFLAGSPSSFKTGEAVAQFYAQSWLATHFLFLTPARAKGFDAYIQALMEGGDVLKSFEPAFGISPAAFDAELKDYRRKPIRFYTLPAVKPDPAKITGQKLGKSVDDLLLPVSHLRTLPARDAAENSIAAIRAQAAKSPEDPYARQCVALAEVWYGDLEEARRQLDAMLTAGMNNADVHHMSGLCYLRAARASDDKDLFEKAQNAFGRAHQLNDMRPQTMFRYVEAGLAVSGMDEALLDVLVSAYYLAPQVESIALTTAQALMSHDMFDEAIAVLRPLTAEVHGSQLSGVARTLTETARQRELSSFSFFGAAMVPGE